MTVVSNPNEYSVEGLVDTGSGNQRVIMTQSVNGTQQAYSETSVECIVEDSSGNKQRCVCVNDFGGGGGGGGVTSVNGQTGAVTLTASDLGALQNTAGASATGALTIDGIPIENTVLNQHSINIGKGSQVQCGDGVAIGNSAQLNYIASGGVALGYVAKVYSNGGIAIGYATTVNSSSQYSIAIGNYTSISQNTPRSIQLGRNVTNNEPNTFKVGFENNNFTLMDTSTGLIPAARHADLPTADGTYTLKLTISGGVPTLSWVAD